LSQEKEQKVNKTYSVQVSDYSILDTIIEEIPCFTREGVSQVIVDMGELEYEQEERLKEIVGDDNIPDVGLVVFYN
jgi:hypothetical protein